MKWTSDFSVERLFIDSSTTLTREDHLQVVIKIPTVKDHYIYTYINLFFNIVNSKKQDFIKLLTALGMAAQTEYEVCLSLLKIGGYKDLLIHNLAVKNMFNFLLGEEIYIKQDQIVTKESALTLDEDLFNYIIYLLRTAEGMKVEPPRTFNSEAERQKYLEALAREERIRQIRANGIQQIANGKEGERKSLLNSLVIIVKVFPQYDFEKLFNMSFLQINFLQQYAGKILKYENEARAYAAGNLKGDLKGFWD